MRTLRCRYPFELWDCTVCGEAQAKPPISTVAGLVCTPCIDRGCRGEPFIPLTVAPARPLERHDIRPILAVCVRDRMVLLEGGELFDLDGLVDRLDERPQGATGYGTEPDEQLPPCLVVTDNGIDLTGFLDHSKLARHPLFNWQVGLRSQGAWRPEARAKTRYEFLIPKPVRFGFASRRGGRRRAHGRARWYQLLDVHAFCELPAGWGEPDAVELLRFGLELREWSNAHGLPVLTSVSAYGSRLLRDARFGGGWRRKVPAATNVAVRRHLPGNHYQLLVDRPVFPRAHKLDQAGAHHQAALRVEFPDHNRLDAAGHFRQRPPANGAPMGSRGPIRAGSDHWRELLARPGLFILAAKVPELVAIDALAIPALRRPGVRWRVMTSVEIKHAQTLPGVRLLDIWACWTSPDVDDRLQQYAWWSLERLQDGAPGWLKPLLLASYGMLAVRPVRFRNAWKWCNTQEGAVGFQTRYGALVGLERSGRKERESGTANVLWRALIESQVRLQSLKFAQDLRASGYLPVSVYADAVFCTGPGTPPAPFPWRYEGVIHDLEFDGAQRYHSREESRLPGTPRGDRIDHNKPVFSTQQQEGQ